MLITVTIISTIISLVCFLLLRQHYQEQLDLYKEANQFHRQTIRCQAERIEQLEQERARLHWQLLAHLSEPGQEVNIYRN